jgi:hypothetical protein
VRKIAANQIDPLCTATTAEARSRDSYLTAGWCASGRTRSGRSLRHLAGKADRWLHMDEDSGSARPLRPTPRMSERCLIRTRTLAWAEWYYLRKDVKKLRPYKPLAGFG